MTHQKSNNASSEKVNASDSSGQQQQRPAAIWVAALQSSLARLAATGVTVRTETNEAGDLCIVLPGYTLTHDANGRANITKAEPATTPEGKVNHDS